MAPCLKCPDKWPIVHWACNNRVKLNHNHLRIIFNMLKIPYKWPKNEIYSAGLWTVLKVFLQFFCFPAGCLSVSLQSAHCSAIWQIIKRPRLLSSSYFIVHEQTLLGTVPFLSVQKKIKEEKSSICQMTPESFPKSPPPPKPASQSIFLCLPRALMSIQSVHSHVECLSLKERCL